MLYEPLRGQKSVIAKGNDEFGPTSMSGGKVAWLEGEELRLYDLSTGRNETVSRAALNVGMGGGRLVWTEERPGTRGEEDEPVWTDVYVRDLSGGTPRRVTDTLRLREAPQVNSSYLVWLERDVADDPRIWAVIAYDLKTGAFSTVTAGNAAGFVLSGEAVAWDGHRGLGDVYLATPQASFSDVAIIDEPELARVGHQDLVPQVRK